MTKFNELNVDCLCLIFNELKTSKKSLHSCLLVNKLWCCLVVPTLWKEYSWYHDNYSESKFFKVILSCLPSSSKRFLSDNNIKLPPSIFLKPPLFNYISFCKFPKSEDVNKMIHMVLEFINKFNGRNLLEREIYKLFVSQCKNIKELWWKTWQPLSLFPEAVTCFSQLHSLSIDDGVNSEALYEMAKFCKDLNTLIIYKCPQELPLISLIESQKNLKEVYLYNIKKSTCKTLSKALERKGNTIEHLYLDLANDIPTSLLRSFVNLKKITIYNRGDIKKFQKYLINSKFPELQSLIVDGLLCFKELAMLIEKTKGNVSNIDIYTTDRTAKHTEMLIKAIVNNCPKIKSLSTHIEPKDFIQVKSLLINCRYLERIKFYSLGLIVNNENDHIGDELLDNLVKFSSETLVDITIDGYWKFSVDAFEKFFEGYRERNLVCFNVGYNVKYNVTEDLKEIVRKYITERSNRTDIRIGGWNCTVDVLD